MCADINKGHMITNNYVIRYVDMLVHGAGLRLQQAVGEDRGVAVLGRRQPRPRHPGDYGDTCAVLTTCTVLTKWCSTNHVYSANHVVQY